MENKEEILKKIRHRLFLHRYQIDERLGCIGVRDRFHSEYKRDEFTKYSPDVICYFEWDIDIIDFEQRYKDRLKCIELSNLLNDRGMPRDEQEQIYNWINKEITKIK